jgi:glycosyltransferase involved in cell wall biosynthesis
MLISVVCPTYQRGAALAATIESVRAQTHQEWELVLVSDGPLDPWLACARPTLEADPRIAVVEAPFRGSPGAGRNAGIARSRGELVAFLDHDDAFAASWLSAVASAVGRGERWVVAGADAGAAFELLADGEAWPSELLTVAPMFEPTRVAMTRTALEAVGAWSTATWGLEDWDYWWRAALAGFSPRSLASTRNRLGVHERQRRHGVRSRFVVPVVRGTKDRAFRIAESVRAHAHVRASVNTALAADLRLLQPALSISPGAGGGSSLVAARDARGWFAGLPFPALARRHVEMAEQIYRSSFPRFTNALERAA